MKTKDNHDNPFEFEANEQLTEDLRGLFETDLSIPEHLDRAVMSQAARHLKPSNRRRWISYWPAYAAAAVITICALFLDFSDQPADPVVNNTPFLKTDIDQNGTVNILDAYKLARAIKSQQVTEMQWDINNDGQVDQRDVDSIAMAAVRINEGVL